jgi:hypothetical protein
MRPRNKLFDKGAITARRIPYAARDDSQSYYATSAETAETTFHRKAHHPILV